MFFIFLNVYALDLPQVGGNELFKVSGVDVTGHKVVEKGSILNRVRVKKGDRATRKAIMEDIARIYDLKFFREVVARRDGNKLIYDVKENPIVSKVTLKGNKLDSEEITKKIRIKELDILDISKIASSVLEIKRYYESKGYFLAEVSYAITERDGKASVEFLINESEKLKIKKIIFLGNSYFSDEQLKGVWSTSEETVFSFISDSGNFNDKAFSIDIERLALFYRSKGFLQVNIGIPAITVTADKRWVFITLKINEGPVFSVNDITFKGNRLFTDDDMRNDLTLKPGDTYSEISLQNDILNMQLKYRDKGYAFANVSRIIELVAGDNKVNINYIFEIGELSYFGRVAITGNTFTRDKVIRRELSIIEGELYNGTALKNSEERVNRLGFFEPGAVVFKSIPQDENTIDIEIEVKERSTGQLSLGGGYSNSTGAFVKAQISQNNFLGRGQSLSLSVLRASGDETFELGLFDPYLLDSDWSAGFNVFYTNNSLERLFGYKRRGFDFRVGHSIFNEDTRLYFTYSLENTKMDNVKDPTLLATLDTVENGAASLIRGDLVLDRRNNRYDPTAGHYVNFSSEYAGIIWGNKRWLKNQVDFRFYYPLWNSLVFKYRLNAGVLTKINNRQIPRVEKFMMGGPQNLRGYYYNTIGPKVRGTVIGTSVDEDFNQGGYGKFLTTLELEHPLVSGQSVKWVVFMDAGNVYSSFKEFSDLELKLDYGFGLRIFLPIGIFRLEYGIPVGDGGPQFNIDIGQSF